MLEINGADTGARTPQDARREELLKLTRPELNQLAQEPHLGIDPNKFGRKEDLVAAMVAAELSKSAPPEADPGEAPPPVPEKDKGPSGRRITDPAWKGLSHAEIEMGLELARARFTFAPAAQNPAQCLSDAAAFVKAAKNMGLI